MEKKAMRLWSISSVSNGRRHTAVVQEVSMQSAVSLYCNTFCGIGDIVTLQCRFMNLNRCNEFGELVPNVAEVPAS